MADDRGSRTTSAHESAIEVPGTPLGKPAGTVRAYLALGIVAAFLVGHVAAALLLLWGGALEAALSLLGALAVAAATVTGCYFGARQGAAGQER